ncbi:MAG: putative toxin-antitoxin system toxin component, PIN family [Caldilineaceae bacterium]|nr:putative toxin-antitoxin system toxin component, PIN family [Caldilineaceae bacterium]
MRIVIDTNIWIRILLRGRITLPILEAWLANRFRLVTSAELLQEYNRVWQRPRLRKNIDPNQAATLYRQMQVRAHIVDLKTIPPQCRDPKDHPVLATAIDGLAIAIVTGDDDLRADDELRTAMAAYGVQLWGVQSFFNALDSSQNQ